MAVSIQVRKRARGTRYTSTVRRAGVTISATFFQRKQAETWARKCEEAIDSAATAGVPFDRAEWLRRGRDPTGKEARAEMQELDLAREPDKSPTPRADWTLRKALEHYDATVTDTLDGARQARARITMWKKVPLADKRLSEITADDIAAWIETRRKARKVRTDDGNTRIEYLPVAASTIRNDTYRISALYEHAITPPTKGGWGLSGLANPVSAVALPALPPGRQRRFDHGGDHREGEEDRVLAALVNGLDGGQMVDFVTIAIEVGMRRSEILKLEAQEIRSTKLGRVVEIPGTKTKNGHPRRIVLTDRATEAVDRRRAGKEGADKLFTLNADAIATRWDIAREKAGCPDLRMHDIRHEALSRMADAGLSVGALAAQSGHRTMQTLLRYVNASERDIREKLARR